MIVGDILSCSQRSVNNIWQTSLQRSLKDFHQDLNLPCSATVGLVVDVTLLLEEISVILSV